MKGSSKQPPRRAPKKRRSFPLIVGGMFVWLVIAAIVYVVGTVVMPERVPRLAQLPAPTAGTVLLVSACNHADVHLALHGRSWYQDGWWWKESPHRKTVPCPTKAAAKPNA